MWISPGSLVDCTITCASPLKSERFGALSLSWQLGSPLPTPISAPFARDLEPNVIIRSRHQAAFFVERFHLDNGKIFAVSVDLVAVRRKPDGNRRPGRLALLSQHHLAVFAAARFNRARLDISPSIQRGQDAEPSGYPGSCPFTNSSTSSRFEYTHTGISSPSLPSKFQCGNT